VFRYLKGTIDLGIVFSRKPLQATSSRPELYGYSDADWGADLITHKSVSGYVFIYANGPISWMSKQQSVVAVSSTESELYALSEATKQALFLCKFSDVLNLSKKPMLLLCDNKSTIAIVSNPLFAAHSRMKHIDIRLHHVHDTNKQGLITISHEPTETMLADFLTKTVAKTKFLNNRNGLQMQ